MCAPVKKLEAVSAFYGMPHPSAPPPPELKSGGDPWAQMVDDNARGGKDDDYGGYGGYGGKGGKGLAVAKGSSSVAMNWQCVLRAWRWQ